MRSRQTPKQSTSAPFQISHGHFVGVHSPDVTRKQARSELGIPQEAFVYGFFGSFQPSKGVEQLMDALRILPQEDSWLAAAGGERANYRDTIQLYAQQHPRIVLRTYPRASNRDLFLVLQGADVMVLPFVATITSGSLILALWWGKPVIAPAFGCLPTTVRENAGILYDPEQEDGLCQAL